MIAAGRVDDMIQGVTTLLDGMAERHARDLLRLKQELRRRYGRSSERLSEDQLALVFEALDAQARAAGEPPPRVELDEAQPRSPEQPEREKRKRRAAKRKPLPTTLPRERIVVAVPEAERACTGCGEPRAVIGFEQSEQLEYIPARFLVREIAREKLACPRCKQSGVVCAPPPPKLVERGLLGSGLVAQVIVAKYKEHCPLYRQREIYKRCGVDLPRSTLGDAVAQAAALLEPVARRIRKRVLAADIVSTDDTGLLVLDRDAPGHIKRGFLWPYVAEGRFASFDYTPTRQGAGPQTLLADFRGYLQVDGHAVYHKLFETKLGEPTPRRLEVGCWAHGRRYFVRALEAGDLRAGAIVALVQQLYRVEREAKERGLAPAERKALRGEQARPVLDKIAHWLTDMQPRVLPKSPLGEAIAYVKTRWTALTRYLEDGRLEIDNSQVERLIRIVAVGRKNFLFAGSDEGAKRAAILYSVIGTAALHEIEPWAYLKDVLEKIAGGWPQRELDALLPDAWAAAHPDALRCPRPA